jgi:CRISPR-associated protein Cas8a1/Csx13
MGKVKYYQSQSIRKGVVDVPADARLLRRYRLLDQHLGNRWIRRKEEQKPSADAKAKPKKANSDAPRASGFISVPTVRGRIADNLIAALPWYASLSTPLQWDMDSLEKQRKRTQGSSIERLWFTNLKYQGRQLVELIQEDDMWDDPNEREFVRAFWETLGALYYREREAVERGGSRAWGERIEDLNENIRRDISRAKTGPLLRETLADLFARPVENYRSPTVRKHPSLIWRLIDKDWKRGRDLALLALASYQSKEKRGASSDDQSERETAKV